VSALDPIWNRRSSPVGWLDRDRGVVYDASFARRAIIQHVGIFTYGAQHVGYFRDGWFRDKAGQAVAYVDGASGGPIPPVHRVAPIPPIQPIPPVAPVMPIPPIMPVPSLSWSSLSFDQLLRGVHV
jgi:hypothetical protein